MKRLATRKDANSAPFDPQFREFEQFRQGPKRTRGDGVHRGNERRRESFDAAAVNLAGAAVERATCRKNAHLRRSLSTQCTTAPGAFEIRIAITIPGNPAPLPRSSQRIALGTRSSNCAESMTCRIQIIARRRPRPGLLCDASGSEDRYRCRGALVGPRRRTTDRECVYGRRQSPIGTWRSRCFT